jgi:hypothetical protein
MSTWLVNDASPESLGLSVVGGVFRNGAASHVQLRCSSSLFDASEVFPYEEPVTIKLDGSAFFRGKVRSIPKSASGSNEAQDFLVEDAWAELERTTYQEPWAVGSGTVLMPRVILGVKANGDRITLGAQIGEALDFAIAAGVTLQKGSIPTGMLLWPEEADGMSCAEVIRTSLRYHPDWLPWIDHSTSPPTFNVTPVASATALSKAITECQDIDIREMQDRLPECVRICFVTANIADDTVQRSITVQKFPTDGPDSGPGVLATTVDLQGVRSTTQKQQVQTRALPTSQSEAKAYIKLKYPALADVPDANFNVTVWERFVIDDDETLPDPINVNAPRQKGEEFSTLPRELVRGNIAEWMQRTVGKVRLKWELKPTSTATLDEVDRIKRTPAGVIITATNAITKIYKGIASWTAGEDAPAGIAETYYNTIHAAARHEGTITIPGADLSARWHGKKLNLTGGASAWSTMAAPIHAVRWDAHRGDATITFGPSPDYALQDFIEYLKLLRRRSPTWMSSAERTSDEIGDESGASASGDNIGPFDTPDDIHEQSASDQHPWQPSVTGEDTVTIGPGFVTGFRPSTSPTNHEFHLPMVGSVIEFEGDDVEVTASGYIYLKFAVASIIEGEGGTIPEIDGDMIQSYLQAPTGTLSVYYSADAPAALDPSDEMVHIPVCKVTVASGQVSIDKKYLTHNPMIQLDANLVYWG